MTNSFESKLEIAVHSAPDLREDNFAPRWIESLEAAGATIRVCDFRATDIIDQLRGVDGAMWHFYHSPRDRQVAPKVLTAIEAGLRIPVFPNWASRWHYDEKIAQHYLLESVGAPEVKTWIFWDRQSAEQFTRSCSYPVVFKLSLGAGSSNVIKLDSPSVARDFVRRMFDRGIQPSTFNEYAPNRIPHSLRDLRASLRRGFEGARYMITGELPPVLGNHHVQKQYLYLQDFMPDNSGDIRITVIGDRAFGFIRRNRPGDFRASGSGIIDWNPAEIPEKAVRIAHRVSLECGFQSMAYDFLIDEMGDPRVNEISYCYANFAVADCPGYWDRELVWHSGSIWPEHAQAEDFLRELNQGTRA